MAYQPPTPPTVVARELASGLDAVVAAATGGVAPPPAMLRRFVAEVQWVWRLLHAPPAPMPSMSEADEGRRRGAEALERLGADEVVALIVARRSSLLGALDGGAEAAVATPDGPQRVSLLLADLAVRAHVTASVLTEGAHVPTNPAAVLSLARAVEVDARGPLPAVTARRLSLRQRRDPWRAFVAERSSRIGSNTDT